MYTESIETERALLVDLCKTCAIDMTDGEIKTVRKCPKCSKGDILIQCKINIEHGNKCWEFKHSCDLCGEVYDPTRIRSDIFFHTPFEMQQRLFTPFGDISVKVNGKETKFRCRNDLYQSHNGKPIPYRIIDIDVSCCKQNDIIECGFDHPVFDDFDGDENVEIAFCSNDMLMLGVGAFAPEEIHAKSHCFFLEDSDYYPFGFRYRVISDPKSFDEKRYWRSKIISLMVGYVRKEDYPEPDVELFLALT